MTAPIRLRSDFDAARLRALAKYSRDPDQTRRLLALAVLYEGGSRTDAARIGAVGLQTVRDWVLRFNAEGPEGLLTGKAPGARPLLNPEQRQALEHILEEGPIPAVHGVVRWRLMDLVQWVWAGWHQSRRLVVPANITLMPLPAKAPELNPVENVWQFLRDNSLSNRIFTSYSDILDHCCEAWNRLTDQPWRIISIGLREWAHGF